jgi:hypothetical protein
MTRPMSVDTRRGWIINKLFSLSLGCLMACFAVKAWVEPLTPTSYEEKEEKNYPHQLHALFLAQLVIDRRGQIIILI